MAEGVTQDENTKKISNKKLLERKFTNNPQNGSDQVKPSFSQLLQKQQDSELISSSDDEFEIPLPKTRPQTTSLNSKRDEKQYLAMLKRTLNSRKEQRIMPKQNKLSIGHIEYGNIQDIDPIKKVYDKVNCQIK
ncbi:hypothetical protein PPERSA_03405 [Pseudocohnilembus persalinus]|uniref:Uncharacterized protein n=1 Tax=Pseudocohnilembus persalinus TaxID=266149 RepID=A0A0V0QC30_PSEPJ|nr:hypothetical protein PPERSA_03405 [Pseudocohnilembus persalinus]|eukprot:KRW99604.1 hypothetical protein PPERSA_03405 [Pseudocohnilembus persalinus]